uniref:MAM domain-containing protein n=1 Tax=Romanomermis culicivorax TaxID=13658 RepID=A0A915I5U6_ROMCU
QIGAGILTFAYWKSKSGPSFKVCGRKPPGYPNALDCGWYMAPKTFQGQQWVKDRVIIPPSDGPFEIVFVAQVSDRNSLVAIDDIQYRASIGSCKNT